MEFGENNGGGGLKRGATVAAAAIIAGLLLRGAIDGPTGYDLSEGENAVSSQILDSNTGSRKSQKNRNRRQRLSLKGKEKTKKQKRTFASSRFSGGNAGSSLSNSNDKSAKTPVAGGGGGGAAPGGGNVAATGASDSASSDASKDADTTKNEDTNNETQNDQQLSDSGDSGESGANSSSSGSSSGGSGALASANSSGDNSSGFSNDGSDDSTTTPAELASILVAPATGVYSENPTATITSTNAETVYYCFSKSSTCCDPESSGSIYTAPVPITSGPTLDEGQFCFAAYAVNSDGVKTSVFTQNYNVSASATPFTFDLEFPQFQTLKGSFTFQTMQLNPSDTTNASNIGFAYNFRSTNPGATDCKALADLATTQVAGDGSLSSFYLKDNSSSTQVTLASAALPLALPIGMPQLNLAYGDNYITGFIEDPSPVDGSVYSCVTKRVTVKDVYTLWTTGTESAVGVSNDVELDVVGFGQLSGGQGPLRSPATVGTGSVELGSLNALN